MSVNAGTRSRFVSVFAVKVTLAPEKLFPVKVSALLPLLIATSWPAALNTPLTRSTPVFVNWNPPLVEVIAPRLLIRLALFKVVVLAVLFTARVPAVMVVTPDCVIAPPAVQSKLRVMFCVPRITAPESSNVASRPLVTATVPKLLVASAKTMSLRAPVEVNVAVGATIAPVCVSPSPFAVKLVSTVNVFKSSPVVSDTITLASVPAEANVTVPVKLLPASLT